jgi:hypothetical protein
LILAGVVQLSEEDAMRHRTDGIALLLLLIVLVGESPRCP